MCRIQDFETKILRKLTILKYFYYSACLSWLLIKIIYAIQYFVNRNSSHTIFTIDPTFTFVFLSNVLYFIIYSSSFLYPLKKSLAAGGVKCVRILQLSSGPNTMKHLSKYPPAARSDQAQ